jgi:hypothetical protein
LVALPNNLGVAPLAEDLLIMHAKDLAVALKGSCLLWYAVAHAVALVKDLAVALAKDLAVALAEALASCCTTIKLL